MTDALLSIDNLHVRFATPDGEVHAVRGISLAVGRGETLAIVGESGSGKSQTMMGMMGLLANNGRVSGSARFDGQEMIGLGLDQLNLLRGRRITMIFQEPMTSLDPLYRIGEQIAEPIMHHRGLSRAEARAEVLDLLRQVQIPDPESRIDSYPHEMSGGQRQRVMIAMALANNPDLIIADEPTTALDVTIQAQILDLLKDLKERRGLSIVFISHDLGIVRRFADRVAVMRSGEVVETGPVTDIFGKPQHDYTKMLLAAEPEGTKAAPPEGAETVLEGQGLSVTFNLDRGWFSGRSGTVRAVDNVSLKLRRGQTIGVVGESGSGKSTLGRALLRLNHARGRVFFGRTELSALTERQLRPLRKHLQLVFQDPFGSLSPRLTAGQIVTEGLLVHEPGISAAERGRRAAEALAEVGLDPASVNRYPHEFSGGQRQRLAIARAVMLKPEVIVLDEPTSALDRSVQKQIIELLRSLQGKYGLSYIFISHDLAVVRALSDHVMVMKSGQVVEEGPAERIFDAPREAYTRELMAAAFGTAPAP